MLYTNTYTTSTILRLVLMAIAILTIASCSSYYTGPVSDHFDGEEFYNPGKPMDKGFTSFLKWKMTSEQGAWPEYKDLDQYDVPPARVFGSNLRISYVGHATVLIQTQGLNILTDPVWSDRVSPVSWAGPSRVHPPGIHFDNLPQIDIILISHNHYDHLDLNTLQNLSEKHESRVIVPLGNRSVIHEAVPELKVEEYDWGDSVTINEQVTISLDPMHHWSARGIFDRNHALWAAFIVITSGGNIYFAGDSGYGGGDYFKEAKEKYRDIRLAIIPIGSYDPRWFMAYGHMNPSEGVKTFYDLGMPYLLPIHYDVFPLADTAYGVPGSRLQELMSDDEAVKKKIQPLQPGRSWFVP